MKTDYPELEGKKVEYFTGTNTYKARVSGVNYHIGITIEGDDRYLVCLNGTQSPNYKLYSKHRRLKRAIYRKVFHLLVKQIKQGFINSRTIVEACQATAQTPTADDCPYAQ